MRDEGLAEVKAEEKGRQARIGRGAIGREAKNEQALNSGELLNI